MEEVVQPIVFEVTETVIIVEEEKPEMVDE